MCHDQRIRNQQCSECKVFQAMLACVALCDFTPGFVQTHTSFTLYCAGPHLMKSETLPETPLFRVKIIVLYKLQCV